MTMVFSGRAHSIFTTTCEAGRAGVIIAVYRQATEAQRRSDLPRTTASKERSQDSNPGLRGCRPLSVNHWVGPTVRTGAGQHPSLMRWGAASRYIRPRALLGNG